MKNKYPLINNWQIEIQSSHVNNYYGRGNLSLLRERSILLAYNETQRTKFRRGKLVRIKDGQAETIFDSDCELWSHVMDGDDIYLSASIGEFRADIGGNKGILFKFNASSLLEWEYQFEGRTPTLPVISEDSIFLTDFMNSTRSGALYRLSKNGDLITKKPLKACASFEPCVLKSRQELVLCFLELKILEIRDFDGNIKEQRSINQLGNIVFSQNNQGNLYAAINHSIVAFDDELNVVWEYKPRIGWVNLAPVFDTEGNSYSFLNMKRLVSLDHNGKERWMVRVFGHGRLPLVLDNDSIMMISSNPTGDLEHEFNAYHIEIFSNNGKKLLEHELSGAYVYALFDKDTLFIVTNGIRSIPEEESAYYKVNVLSLRLH